MLFNSPSWATAGGGQQGCAIGAGHSICQRAVLHQCVCAQAAGAAHAAAGAGRQAAVRQHKQAGSGAGSGGVEGGVGGGVLAAGRWQAWSAAKACAKENAAASAIAVAVDAPAASAWEALGELVR